MAKTKRVKNKINKTKKNPCNTFKPFVKELEKTELFKSEIKMGNFENRYC
jgi:hypothetical protein